MKCAEFKKIGLEIKILNLTLKILVEKTNNFLNTWYR